MFAYWIGEHQQGSTISDLYESRHVKTDFICTFNAPAVSLGTLSKDEDKGSENVGKKNEFAFFQT